MNIILNKQYLINASKFISTDEVRFYLHGVHIYKKDNKIIYEATNGHILYKAIELAEYNTPDFNIILKGDFKKLKKEGLLELNINNKIYIINDNFLFTNIEANFPDLDRVIPALDKLQPITLYVKFKACYLAIIEEIVPKYELLEADAGYNAKVAINNNETIAIMPIKA